MSQFETALRAIIAEEVGKFFGDKATDAPAKKPTATKPTKAADTAKPAEAAKPAGPSKKELADAVVALAKIPEGGRDSAVGILKKHGVEKVSDLAEAQYAAVHKDVLASTESFSTPEAAEPASLV
jgi:hypothetical protein